MVHATPKIQTGSNYSGHAQPAAQTEWKMQGTTLLVCVATILVYTIQNSVGEYYNRCMTFVLGTWLANNS